MAFERYGDFRYQGQEYVLTIPIVGNPVDMAATRAAFDAAYDRQYGHSSPDSRLEVATLRVAAVGRLPRPGIPDPQMRPRGPARQRKVYFDGVELATAIIERAEIGHGEVIDGPAIIEEATATTLVPPKWQARIISGGHLTLTRKPVES